MPTFKIIPLLGIRNDVPPDDKRMFQSVGDGVALCHCAEGQNFDLMRNKGTCSRFHGAVEWSATPTTQKVKCLGLFELYDGTYRDWLIANNGKIYYFDASKDAQDVSGAITLATDDIDIYSMVQVGSHIVIADRAETTPYCWKHGDAAIAKAISSGTEFKFRYLNYFSNRLIGLYSDQTNGDIEVRWSGLIPVPGTSCVFGAASSTFVPNDDPITGCAKMDDSSLYIYSENSIHQMQLFGSYLTPFKIFTTVTGNGCSAPHSIVKMSDRTYLFNKNYGFCEYRGGNVFPYGGEPISQAIDSHIQDISPVYYDLIVGKLIPWRKQVVWTVPASGSTTPSKFFIYDLYTGQWTISEVVARYIDCWNLNVYTSITALESAFGYDVEDLDPDNKSFAYYDRTYPHVVISNTNGEVYLNEGSAYGSNVRVSYREEPVLDFGNPRRFDKITEIWFDFATSLPFRIGVEWRGGNTLGELLNNAWEGIGTISHSSPARPFLSVDKSARLHQIKWTSDVDKAFQVSGITFNFQPGSER